MELRVEHQEQRLLQSLLQVGVNLSVLPDRQTMLEVILQEARKLTYAEAGTLYVRMGETLQFVAAQNDKLKQSKIDHLLKGNELALHGDSLAAFVAVTGNIINISDSYNPPPGSPFRINHDFDSATGYRTKSILAIPLMRHNGHCIGVLQLINCIEPGCQIGPFASEDSSGIVSMVSMAAVTIHNSILQEQLKGAQLDSIIRLSVAAEFRDDDTADHIHRISRSSAIIAAALGLDREKVEIIQYASSMHDIGKIGIPDSILRKNGPLSEAEHRIVQTHTLMGADILHDPPNELIATAREVAMTHHERMDGKGYPHGLSGRHIPLSGRIVGLADVFDALVKKRCYKEAFPLERALEIIRSENGKHFDPEVTEAFSSRLDVLLIQYGDIS